MTDETPDKKTEEAKRLLEEKENSSNLEYDQNEEVEVNPDSGRPTLGMAEKPQHKEAERQESKKLADEMGWHNIPIQDLPSAGLFYADDAEVAIKSAKVQEIRHFSTIDENDPFDIDDKLNFVVDKCLKVRLNGVMASWKDLKDEDRFYLIFAIRDLTFKEGENKLMINLACTEMDCKTTDKIELKNGIFDYYKIEGKLMNYYDQEEKCFAFDSEKVGKFNLYVPSLGVTSFIKNYVKKKQQAGESYDLSFVKVAPFVFGDWRLLNDASYQGMEQESFGWNKQKFSAIHNLTEKIRFGVKLSVTQNCSECGAEVTAPLTFPNGVKSLFVISDENVWDIL